MMNNLLSKVAYFSWIFSKICVVTTDDESIDDITSLTTNLQEFYSSPSVIFVYDKQFYGLEMESTLLNTIKSYSRLDRFSRTVSYDNLAKTHHENALFVLVIDDRKNLEYTIATTRKVDLTSHPWLLIAKNTTDFNCNAPDENFFKLGMNARMTAKCHGNEIIKRYYGVKDDRTEVLDLAVWQPEKKYLEFMDKTHRLVDMQTNMKGITLKVANKTDPQTSDDEFCRDIIEELKTLCHFSTSQGPRDKWHGFYDNRIHRWTGLISIVKQRKADIGGALFRISNMSMTEVDFATPILRGNAHLYARLPKNSEVRWDAYFKVWNRNATLVNYALTLIFAVLLCLMTRCLSAFFEYFIQVWGIFCQQGLADTPSNDSIKLAYFSIIIWSLIINTIYPACITSYIAASSPKLPFDTYEDFKANNWNYEVTVVEGSGDYDRIISKDPMLSPLKRLLKKKCLIPATYYAGFLQACEPNTIFYTNEVEYESLKNNLPCELGSIRMKRIEYWSFILTKDSPYTKTMNYMITRLRDHGILNRLKAKHFRKLRQLSNSYLNSVTFEQVTPILMIWAIGLAVALIGLIMEIVTFRLLINYSVEKIENFVRQRQRIQIDHSKFQ